MTEKEGLVLVIAIGSTLTLLVGGVVSISQEIDFEPVPVLPSGSRMWAALTVRV